MWFDWSLLVMFCDSCYLILLRFKENDLSAKNRKSLWILWIYCTLPECKAIIDGWSSQVISQRSLVLANENN